MAKNDPLLVQLVLTELRGVDTSVVKMYPMSNGVARLVDEVIAAVGGRSASIGVLRIWGHGWLGEGGEQFVAGHTEGTSHRSSLSSETVKAMDSTFDRLRGYFAPGARVELRACNVAKPAGKAMMLELARRWQTRIHGATQSQFSPRWLAPIMEATPGGAFHSIAGIQIGEKA